MITKESYNIQAVDLMASTISTSMKPPESIILAFANTSVKYLNSLYYELSVIRDNALKNAVEENHITIIENNGAGLQPLSNLLNSARGRQVTMLHYSGHSNQDGLIIQWQEKKGIIKTALLSNLVAIHKKFRFIFLNSCYSENIALELIKIGVPYVIGTTDSIDDKQAAIVAGQFYYFLAKPDKTIKDAFLLTKIYFEDASYNDNAGIREAFRNFDTSRETLHRYPWKMYESPEIDDKDKNWTLVPSVDKGMKAKINRKRSAYFTISGACFIILMLLFLKLFVAKEMPVSRQNTRPDSIIAIKPLTDAIKDHTNISQRNKITSKKIVIEGRVADDKTEEPIDSVTVLVNGIKHITNKGRFKIELPAIIKPGEIKYLIIEYTFMKPAYQTKIYNETISVNNNTDIHKISVRLIKIS